MKDISREKERLQSEFKSGLLAYHEYREQLRTVEQQALEVGDGVTLNLWSDRQAYTIIRRTPYTLTLQRDKATLDPNFKPEFIVGGFAAHCTNQDEQSYTYERDPNGGTTVVYWSKKYGRFMYLGKSISVGRHEFYDYNF